MERTYGSLVRHELGSSYSALDGVPFKIGRAFRRPEQIQPPQLSSTKPAAVLSEEYTFETEEAVLAWAKARDEAVKKAAEEQADRLKEKEKQKAEAEQAEAEAARAAENDNASASNADPEEISVYDVPRYSIPQPKNEGNSIKPPLPPKASGLGTKAIPEPGTVLTPIPIKPTFTSSEDKVTSTIGESSNKVDSQFDLTMFEAEADPFDNLELQTLNDMEELKVLLNSNSVNTHGDFSIKQEAGAEASGSCVTASESFVDSTESATIQSGMNAQSGIGAFSEDGAPEQGGASSSIESTLQSCVDGEYVEITPKYKAQSETPQSAMGVLPGGKSTPLNGVAFHKPSPAGVASFPASSINNQIYKPVLPPITKSERTTDAGKHNSVPSQQATAAYPGDSSSDTAPSQMWNSPSPSPRDTGKGPPLKQPNGREFVCPSPPLSTHSVKPARPAPPPPTAAKPILRNKPPAHSSEVMSCSTGPSLAMFLGNSGQSEERSIQSSYSRHCNSTSDLIAGSTNIGSDSPRRNSAGLSPQPWNRHVPLPPPPSSNAYKPSYLPTAQPVGLPDPYSSLTREEQSFTDILTNMGFLRPRVARAVQKFGTKEKEVLDHLLAADKLGEQSYAPVMVESALFTFKNDLEKAEKFLQLHAQFEELGFQRDKIHDALVSTDLEHDKALDILTA